jgi:hypothetical protein
MRKAADQVINIVQNNYLRRPDLMRNSLQVAGYIRDKLDKEPSIIVAGLLHNYGQACVKDGKRPFHPIEHTRAYFSLKSLGFPQEVIAPIYNLSVPEEYFWTKNVCEYTPFHDTLDRKDYVYMTMLLHMAINNSRYYRVSEKGIYAYYDYMKYVLNNSY